MLQFRNDLGDRRLRTAYNNDIFRFTGNEGIPAYADVTIDQTPVRLYPAPNGDFFINLKPYITALININNFEDRLVTNINREEPDSFIYNSNSGTLLRANVKFEVNYTNNTSEYFDFDFTWIAGAEQHDNYNYLDNARVHVLSPFSKSTANHYYLKYWQGYPFDIAFYTATPTLKLENTTNLLNQTFNILGVQYNVSRLVLSNGDEDETLEDLLPLAQGFNSIKVKQQEQDTEHDKFISLEKVPYKQGLYLKWLNSMGGYSYWLFENTYSIDRSTKQLGELDRDYANLEDSFGRTIQIGKESQDTIKIVAELLTENERHIVEGILDSPKIYLFTGKPYARSDYRSWIEVSLKTSSARLKNPRQPLTNFTFDVELPVRFTQTL